MISLIPWPKALHRHPGEHTLSPQTVIVAGAGAQEVAGMLHSALCRGTGWALALETASPPAGAPVPTASSAVGGGAQCLSLIELELTGTAAQAVDESYELLVTPLKIVLKASSCCGLFYAMQTLLQLLPAAIYGVGPRIGVVWSLPCVLVEDAPRFGWRGAMLDCVRHFMPVAFIKKFIDLIALHKINRFHWHLTDDQGWRIEIKKYPLLTQKGSHRSETAKGHHDARGEGDGVPHGGYYTQEQVRDIVNYAARRHITIIPEIEMPGHATAAIHAYPQLGCTGKPIEVSTRWGVHEDIYNVTELVFAFIQDVLEEVMALFPSEYIHVGGDEVPKAQWRESADAQARIREQNLKDEDELQSYFISRIGNWLAGKGRRLIGWDEIMEGGIPQTASIMVWRSDRHAVAAAEAGHDVVMAWTRYTYLDCYQSAQIDEEPLCGHSVVTLEDACNWNPLPQGLSAEAEARFIGLQGQLWTEYMTTPSVVEYMAFPRLCALAQVAWAPPAQVPTEAFLPRLHKHLKRLDVLDVNYCRNR